MNENLERLHLNDGNSVPKIGFGIYKIKESEMEEAIGTAYRTGYRLFDTASFYENEAFLGNAIRKSGIKREDIQIATKAWPTEMGYDEIKNALKRSLQKLQTDYVDIYFIHWPVRDAEKMSETWRAMEAMKKEGLIRSIAVCNFKKHHFDALMKGNKYLPVINQIERHPLLTQKEMAAYGNKHHIVTEAWSPLMRGNKVFQLEIIKKLAEKYEKTPAQIILNWNIMQGILPIPKSVTPCRIEENFHSLDFALTEEECREIDALNRDERSGDDPDNYPFDKK